MMVGPPSPTLPSPFLLPLLSTALGRGVSVTSAAEMAFDTARRACLSVLVAAKLVLGLLHGSTVLRPSILTICNMQSTITDLGYASGFARPVLAPILLLQQCRRVIVAAASAPFTQDGTFKTLSVQHAPYLRGACIRCLGKR